MITLIALILIFLTLGFGITLGVGIISTLPGGLIILASVILDVLVFKLIFKK